MKNLEMFNLSNSKYVSLFLLPLVFCGGIFALEFDIGGGISEYLTNYVAKREQNSYINAAYKSNFSADPFADAVERSVEEVLSPLLGGMENVSARIQKNSCSLSKKELSTILYYFDESFHSQMFIELSQNTNQYFQSVPDQESAIRACKKYVDCRYGGSGDILTLCRDDIVPRYQQGFKSTTRFQSVLHTQVGKDKYWNSSLEDSPYDLMYDITAIGKVMFEDIQQPVEVFFYHMPNYKGSPKGSNASQGGSSSTNGSDGGSLISVGNGSSISSEESPTLDPSEPSETSEGENSENGDTSDLWGAGDDDEFSDFLDSIQGGGTSSSLGGSSLQSTIFGGNICIGTLDDVEDISEETVVSEGDLISLDDVSDEEYQLYIDDLLDQLDSYLDDPEDVQLSGGTMTSISGSLFSSSNVDGYAEAVNQVATCFSSCDGLRVDKKAACMAMCACGQRDSPLFDPYKTPGLGPIMSIKFCTVPATPKTFSQRGLVVYSIEKIFEELYGVLNSLDRSGELGVNVKQSEFLDSSTKKMSFSKSISFTISQTKAKPTSAQKGGSPYLIKVQLEKDNADLEQANGVSHSLDNPVLVNAYLVLQDVVSKRLGDSYVATQHIDKERSDQTGLQQAPVSVTDPLKGYQNERYIQLSTEIYTFLSQQLAAWLEFSHTIEEMNGIFKKLSAKPAS